MLRENLESKWIDCFEKSFLLSGVSKNNTVAIISETQSRQVLIDLSMHALSRIGAKPIQFNVPTPKLKDVIPVRSTGSCYSFEGYEAVLPALSSCDLIIDCTVEGMLHSKELQTIIKGGGRLLMISNEHPEVLERCMPDENLTPKVISSLEILKNSKTMKAVSYTHLTLPTKA